MKKILSMLSVMVFVSCGNPPGLKEEKEEEPQEPNKTEQANGTEQANEGKQADYDSYFAYNGKKIPVEMVDGKFYVVFYSADMEVIKEELSEVGVTLDNVKAKGDYTSGSAGEKFVNCTTGTIRGSYEKVTPALSRTLYWSPYYKSADGAEMGMTEKFVVVLKPGTTASRVEELAKEYSVETIGIDKSHPTWYHLACTVLSKGNSLFMANLFYASGLFEDAFPSRILLVTFNDIEVPGQ